MARLARRRRSAAEGDRRSCRTSPPMSGRPASRDVLLLGMGGSSLGPEVFAKTFGAEARLPGAACARFDRPGADPRFESRIDLARTLFIVSSKSGSTLEPNIFKQYFFERAKAGGRRRRGGQALRRDHRSRLVARKDGADRRLPAHLPRAAEHRRALFGAVEFRHGAGRGDRARPRAPFSRVPPRWCAPARRARRRSRTPG